jgi:hypothetical protein
MHIFRAVIFMVCKQFPGIYPIVYKYALYLRLFINNNFYKTGYL